MDTMNTTISLTFGDAGENHVGMEMLGELSQSGISCDELKALVEVIDDATFHDFGMDAGVLIIRNILNENMHKEIFKEVNSQEWDTKYFDRRRKCVLNKHARANIMILDDVEQEPDYENAKGRIVDGTKLENFNNFKTKLIDTLSDVVGNKVKNLICEGNKYADNTKNGIGFHGDAERRIVIALRLGASMPMHWQWFQNSEPIGKRFEFNINGGDLYIMSDKAVGNDWRKRLIPTLRHAAGASKYLKIVKTVKRKLKY